MKLDLNFPDFQEDLFDLPKQELTALMKAFRLLSKMDFDQLLRHSGFHLEHIKHLKTRQGQPIYSLRITRSCRATLTIEHDYLRFLSIHPDHDSTYK